MIDKLMIDLTRAWHEALDWRLRMSSTSPVPVLNRLLQARTEELRQHDLGVAA
jgi:hypothetical protein